MQGQMLDISYWDQQVRGAISIIRLGTVYYVMTKDGERIYGKLNGASYQVFL